MTEAAQENMPRLTDQAEVELASRYKVAVYVPEADVDKVKQAALSSGAGKIGSYIGVCFCIPGTSHFTPLANSRPAIGRPGEPEVVREVKLELSVTGKDVVRKVVQAIRDAHPYEEVVCDVYQLLDF